MNRRQILFWVWILGGASIYSAWSAPDARQIMLKSEEARKLPHVQAEATITIGDSRQEKEPKIKKFTWWRKLQKDGVHFDTLTRFHYPPEIRGEKILFLERPGDSGNEVLLYLPTFKKIRRVENQQQSGKFMSSEFSYSDISTTHVDDYRFTYKKADGDAHVIQSEPINDSVKTRTGYSQSILWIDKNNFMPTAIDHYDLTGHRIKHLTLVNTEVLPSEHKWMAKQIKVENLATDRYTTLIFEEIKAQAALADSLFTQQALMKDR